jgi:aryl-alcohol dehydrogenase-like predicted oxidoreductase
MTLWGGAHINKIMETRKLGSSELQVSPIMLGGNVFGWTADEATSFRILDAFVDREFNFVDTADVYTAWIPGHSGGESETVIGKWLSQSGKRNKVVIATKVGMEVRGQKGLSKDHILRSAEESLRRLQTDHIDLYQSHSDDPDTNFEETLSAYAQLIQEGKVRAIGGSNYSADRLTQILEVAKNGNLPAYCSLQPLYNLYDREDYEANLEPVAKTWNLGVVPYYSLAAGFLTGKYRSQADLENRARGKTVEKYLNERGHRILAALDHVAEEYRSTPAAVAIAWLAARPSVTAPIVSATSIEQLDTILGAADLQLSPKSIVYLDTESAVQSVQAAKWAEQN